jgi:energy-converting hydrogenase A subunit R
MDEYDHMDELGLTEDHQFICGCHGFLTPNNSTRDLCARYMRDGGRVFDVLTAYETVAAIDIRADREDGNGIVKMLVPLLRANGVTDHSAYTFFKENLNLMPGAEHAMHYIRDLEPCFINTEALDHQMMNVTDLLGIPMTNVNCSQAAFDSVDIGRREGKELRDFTARLARMDPNVILSGDEGLSVRMVGEIDAMIADRLPKMDFFEDLSHVVSIGANEKSYTLLEIRNQTNIEFNSTFYVGSGPSDHLAMDIVKDTGGLAVSFNGCREAVWNADIAIMSRDSTVIALLAAEFYDSGMESVHSLIDGWGAESLRKKTGPDRHLIDELLRRSGRGLPEVVRVTEDNMEAVAEKSESYRRRLADPERYRKNGRTG